MTYIYEVSLSDPLSVQDASVRLCDHLPQPSGYYYFPQDGKKAISMGQKNVFIVSGYLQAHGIHKYIFAHYCTFYVSLSTDVNVLFKSTYLNRIQFRRLSTNVNGLSALIPQLLTLPLIKFESKSEYRNGE